MKTLRVQVEDELWEALSPHLKHGEISRILRHALRVRLDDIRHEKITLQQRHRDGLGGRHL